MPMQNATETHLPEIGEMHPSGSKRTGARVVFYLVLILIVGLIVWRVYQNHLKQVAATANQAAALQGRPVPVQVTAVEQKPMPIFLSALGTVTPYMSVTVKARVSGELLPVKFTEGQEVNAGETIMEIDPKPYLAALDQAKGTLANDQALLKNAQAEYNRYKALGGPVERIIKPGADHHPHGLTEPRPIVELFERAWRTHGPSPSTP